MSRAFVKEADAKEPRCPQPPGCGGVGIPVSRATIEANTAIEPAVEFHGEPFYCPDPDCVVAYFDGFGTRVERTATLRRAWPKDGDAPVCSCFGITVTQIEEWADRGEKARVRELLDRTKSADAKCLVTAPDGRRCEEKVRRVFLRALGLESPGA